MVAIGLSIFVIAFMQYEIVRVIYFVSLLAVALAIAIMAYNMRKESE